MSPILSEFNCTMYAYMNVVCIKCQNVSINQLIAKLLIQLINQYHILYSLQQYCIYKRDVNLSVLDPTVAETMPFTLLLLLLLRLRLRDLSFFSLRSYTSMSKGSS